MTNALALIRSLIIYSLCLPLAIYLGYLLAMPMDRISYTVVVVAIFLPLVPVLLKWHHLIMFGCWNTSMVLFFLTGRPNLWLAMALLSFTLAILQHILNRNQRFISVPAITRPLILLALVIVVTAKLTGGFGMRSIGGEAMGGKRYILLLGAILGYFAMTAQRVPDEKASTYVAVYFLGSLTAIFGSLAPFFPGSLRFIFALFPVENLEAFYDSSPTLLEGLRLGGVSFTALCLICYIQARHGIRGLFNLSETWGFFPVRLRGGLAIAQPWRILFYFVLIWISLMGGYRSTALILGGAFLIQFCLEGLLRTQLFPMVVMALGLALAASLPVVHKLPLTIQRSLSFLPLKVDPLAREAADSSTQWRLQMWKLVLPSVPQYLILGKGYAINPNELAQVISTSRHTTEQSIEGAIMASDFHNGPLSLVIPLGIFGVIAFLWFLYGTLSLMIHNYRHSSPALRQINTFLLAYFLARVLFFLFVFGSFHNELLLFTGLAGLSVCLNGGRCQPVPAPVVEKPLVPQLKLARIGR